MKNFSLTDFVLKLFISYFLSQIIFMHMGVTPGAMVLTLIISFIVFVIIDGVGNNKGDESDEDINKGN
jgi:hypothetical protein